MNATVKRWKRQLLADKRKLGLMCALLGLALLLWGRLLLTDVPRTAVADPAAVTAAASGDMVAPGAIELGTDQATPIRRYPTPRRDLFAFDAKRFPSRQRDVEKPDPAPKSSPSAADELSEQVKRRMAVRIEARSLSLQSTVLGTNSRALINGVLIKPGEEIQGFTLIEVKPRQATVVKDGVEVTLEM